MAPLPLSFLLRSRAVPTLAATALVAALRLREQDHLHKPLWPLDARDYAAAGLGALALVAAALGGVGGGGILLPIYILVLGFRAKQAVALAVATILGGAIANVAFAAWRRHPYADRPSVNWTLVVLFEPLVIFGSVVGSFANKLLPEAVLQVVLVALYGTLSCTTARKAVAQVHAEGGWARLFKPLPADPTPAPAAATTAAAAAASTPDGATENEDEEAKTQERSHLLRWGRPRGQSYPPAQERLPFPSYGAAARSPAPLPSPALLIQNHKSSYSITGYSSSEETKAPSPPPVVKRRVVQRIKARERTVRWWKPALMTLCFAGVAALRIGQRLVSCGSWRFCVLTLALLPWVLPFFLVARRHVLADFRRKRRFGYPPAPGDVRWDRRNSIRWPLVCSAAGVMSGMLGSSGGTIKAPLLLELGTPPTVVAATVATMVLYTSATSTLTLTVFGLLPHDYGAVLFAFGFVITSVTNYAAARFLGRRRKQSLATLSIAAVIALSTLTMGLQAGVRIARDPRSALEVGSLCR